MEAPSNLLLAAFEPELAGVEGALPRNWMLAKTGIGGITAAVTTARLIAEVRPQKVLFVGTCGTYSIGLDIGDCIAASEAIVTSVSEAKGRAFRPKLETTRWCTTWELPLPKHLVLVPPAITSDLDDATLLGQIADVEHLELGGVFAACHQADVCVAAALVIANHVGPNAHSEWSANHESASRRLVDTLINQKILE
ncbi:MAG: phosphorylase [Holophagaceae bacterium]|nr:phosphorylase [Holophagaceae bacterium]